MATTVIDVGVISALSAEVSALEMAIFARPAYNAIPKGM
jgi:hypothetical protein